MDFADLCTYVYIIVDALDQAVVAPHDHRPGPRLAFSESEVITFFGYKLHLLATYSGLILDFALALAHHSDEALIEQLFIDKHWLTVLGAKAYLNAALQELLAWRNNLTLLTPKRINQHEQWPPALTQAVNHFR